MFSCLDNATEVLSHVDEASWQAPHVLPQLGGLYRRLLHLTTRPAALYARWAAPSPCFLASRLPRQLSNPSLDPYRHHKVESWRSFASSLCPSPRCFRGLEAAWSNFVSSPVTRQDARCTDKACRTWGKCRGAREHAVAGLGGGLAVERERTANLSFLRLLLPLIFNPSTTEQPTGLLSPP